MAETLWNNAFTDLIRKTNQAGWGNWTLHPSVKAGAVGYILTETSTFKPLSVLPDFEPESDEVSEQWTVESKSTRKSEKSVTFNGGYKDPSTGKEVKVGTEVSWGFSEEGSLASNGTTVRHTRVKDYGVTLQRNFDWLQKQAASVGYAHGSDGIAQGFGVITSVKMCSGGVNIASQNKNNTFSLTGSVDGIAAMTGSGSASAGIKGSYKSVNETNSFESHLWPAVADTAAPSEMGISYEFSSFHGKLLMPTWITPLSGFSFVFNNDHGGTYICVCTVDYVLPNGQRGSRSTTASGSYVRVINDIPLDSVSIHVHIHFKAGGSSDYSWDSNNPIAQLPGGQVTFDLGGVWPRGGKVTVRK